MQPAGRSEGSLAGAGGRGGSAVPARASISESPPLPGAGASDGRETRLSRVRGVEAGRARRRQLSHASACSSKVGVTVEARNENCRIESPSRMASQRKRERAEGIDSIVWLD